MNKIVKVWRKDYGRWWLSGKGRDSWSSIGKAKAAMKTSYGPNCEIEFVTFDLVEVSREVWSLA